MKVIDLTKEHQQLYFLCLEDWSDEAREAGPGRSIWYNKMKAKGLRVKLALDDKGEVGGMIQYGPVEHSFLEGRDSYFIYCIWVHGYKKGRGNFQKKGMGKALLKAAEEDVMELGGKGMAAWGISLPFWMKASWFKKHGYEKVDKMKGAIIMWKPFVKDACPPEWIRKKKDPGPTPGKVTVSSFMNGWCLAQNLVNERVKRAATGFGEKVIFRQYDTSDRDVLYEWGISDALYIDEKSVRTGPPPSYKKIRKLIAKRVRKL